MVSVWRIATDTPSYTADDLSGAGALHAPGRWHVKGTPMVYAASTRALACLETLVHLQGGASLPFNRYLVEITLPQASWDARTVFDPSRHVGWDSLPAGRVSIAWGDAWAQGISSLIAIVPSVAVPQEWNILINPRHPDMARVSATKVQRWLYDPRFFGFSL